MLNEDGDIRGRIDLRWAGAGMIPARHFGYWHATSPLVQVHLFGDCLTVRIQPGLVRRLVGAETLSAVPIDGIIAYRVHSNAAWQGIEFRSPRRPSFYFFTRRREAVLAALSETGFTVSAQLGREHPA